MHTFVAAPPERELAPGSLVRLPAGSGLAPRLGIVAEVRAATPTVWVFPYDEHGRLLVGPDGAPRAAAYVLSELESVQPNRREGRRDQAVGGVAWQAGAAAGTGELRDVSLDGVGFVTGEPPLAGEPIAVVIACARGGPAALQCVVRTVTPTSDGQFRVGCQFARRVPPEDLAALLP